MLTPFELCAEPGERGRRRRAAASATASVLAEVPGELSDHFKADLAQAVEGTLSPDELYERTLRRYQRRVRETRA
jgi:hypothetical protein